MDPEMSPDLTTDDLQPAKTGVKTGYQTINGHISQIPGLSPSISTLPEERARGRRVRVLESDSDYVKLAKQGGHKGLLWHEDSLMSDYISNAYKAPDWFCTVSGEDSKPSEEKKSPGAFQPAEPPFGTDSMSAWERDDNSSDEKKKDDVHAQNSQTEKMQTSNPHHHITKFRRIAYDKKPAPVEMSKLLSFGYADDNAQVQ
ncbi:uncharacterized protein C7orf57 homolog [Parambassis ranga]|uniref:Uncharacterized protein C7orf57 homolog n=1 Tax=Parambassis ranga TaxID=210632 RepID=A0A6P7H4L7_9TELE|nr:uncharacterized protein C7orf57 homolog [Parambassis ranga]